MRRAFFPPPREIPPPDPSVSRTIHQVPAGGGSVCEVWRLEASSPKARLIFCHGYSANRYQVFGLANWLRARGYEGLLLELRGHGTRSGPCTFGIKETEDVLAVLRWSRSHDGAQPLAVGLVGWSLGGAVVCQVAARDHEVRAVVTDSVYSTFFPVVRRIIRERYHLPAFPFAWFTWWGIEVALGHRLEPLDPAAVAPRLRQPLLAIQGGDDDRLRPELGQMFYQRWAGPKERWGDPHVGHVGMFAQSPDAYGRRVAHFLDRVFTQGEGE